MHAGHDTHPAVQRSAPGLNERAFLRADAFILRNLGRNFTLADVAAAACISRFHFARQFRQRVGCSPMAYVMRLRLERAKEMLARGDQRIADTAAALGFYDQSHFTRTFRRATGVSPRAFSYECRHAGTTGATRILRLPDTAQANAHP
ncbi:helix-turn-helix transcriptional regulator [Pseudoxanthomonas japonensis]|uniref:AraC family transcriptional regulator n=1 Tax=Pseudoxanthomonas japonensis TaxID=69284 RepID=A0ABQ6ZFT3_9GAMM|nr:helix-turn-helix transcriptional regulator [Pseudoxanthomonas japonensis]KAF1724459.1 AraC family transcriptional regulator [Pseudoxanthomonas japonensis]